METIGSGSIQVLIVPPYFDRTVENLFRTMSKSFKKTITVRSLGAYSLPRLANGRVNFESVLQKCRDVIRKDKIDVLYADGKGSYFLLAILHEEFPHLRGPSIESVFLCSNALYRNRLVDSGRSSSLPYTVVNLNSDVYDLAQAVLNTFGCPGKLMLSLELGRQYENIYRNRDQLIKCLIDCKETYDLEIEDFRKLIHGNVDIKSYPLALEPIVLIEPLEDANLVTDGNYWLRIDIDACICDGKFILWGMIDYVKNPYRDKTSPYIFLGKQMPSEIILQTTNMQNLWKRFENDVKNLIKFGLNNCMIRGQYKLYDSGDIRLIKLTPALKPDSAELYIRHMGEYADTRIAAILVGFGSKKISSPIPTPTFAMLHILTVPVSMTLSALVNCEKCIKNKDVVLRFVDDQTVEVPMETGVEQFGSICVTGNHFLESILKIQKLREDILLVPEIVLTKTNDF